MTHELVGILKAT